MNTKDLLDKLNKGEIKAYMLRDYVSSEDEAAEIRREYLRKAYGAEFNAISSYSISLENARRNIENPIGAVQVPVSYVEIQVNGQYAKGKLPIFLSTTEGMLIAGVSRGASAINASGGVTTHVIKSSMTRSQIIEVKDASGAAKALDFINNEGKAFISEEFSKHTHHGKLLDVRAWLTGRFVFIRYEADTAAAMGMNMVTIASTPTTKAIIDQLARRGVEARFVSESGNMCVDKKPSFMNKIEGRGVSVVAEAVIPKEIIEKYFKVSAEAIRDINYAKNYIGSSLSGSLGNNAHTANIIAAAFLAYGQDMAEVVDSSNAMDDIKAENGNLYISQYNPSMQIGTFGGGTKIETANELLKASKVYGEGDDIGATKLKLAELIAAASLAGDLNLLAAEAGGELADSHASLKSR